MDSKPKILIVEDERPIARFLQIALEKTGFRTAIEGNGRRAYDRIIQEGYDLILLDYMLPEMTGIDICSRVREVSDVPIIMLTARDSVQDQVDGLILGANDYITKPFSSEVLLAKIRGILARRNSAPRDEEKRFVTGSVILYPERYEARFNGELIDLTTREYELLQYFVENKDKVLSRDQILQSVWGYDYPGGTNVVDVYVNYLRTKIDYHYNEPHIHTKRGAGYVLKD